MFDNNPLVLLYDRFVDRDWFHSVGMDKSKRLVVYVKYMCDETTNDIPRQVDGINVLCHFATSKHISKELFTPKGLNPIKNNLPPLEDLSDVELIEEPDLSELIKELVHLEKMCGSNIMQDIFYEVHDGINAVTNLSSKFPDVKRGMEKLYEQYGFDLIYENMDG